MATFENPTGDVGGGDDDDIFIFNRPISGTVNVFGGNGHDALILSGGNRFLLQIEVRETTTFASILAEGGNLTVRDVEKFDITGSLESDSFTLWVWGTVDSADISLDGGGGGDFLRIWVRDGTPLTFTASETGASSSVGTFSNFAGYVLELGTGDDTIHSGNGNDGIISTGLLPGFDTIYAEGGDDIVSVSADGYFDGGDGFDQLALTLNSSADFRLGLAEDGTITSTFGTFISFEQFRITLGSGNDGIITGGGDDVISGGLGDDYIQTGAGNDTLRGGSGVNTLIGGPGDDIYYAGPDDVIVEVAGEGYDTVYTTVSFSLGHGSNLEALVGTGTNLTLSGNERDNAITGSFGDDILIGGAGADILDGAGGADYVSYEGDGGAVFVNLTLGRGFTNTSFGDTYISIENVLGTDFADFIIGDEGENYLQGNGGDDVLIGGLGADFFSGGAGSDWLSYEDNSGSVFINLTLARGYNNAAEGDQVGGMENIVGGLFDDFFIGDNNANRLDGAMGADTLLGAGGADVFMFTYAPGATSPYGSANVDLILDFTSGEDTIELASSAFAGLTAGMLPDGAFYAGTAAHDGDDRIVYDAATGQLWFDPDGTGGQAAMLFATLGDTSHPAAIAASDFVVV